MNEEEIRVIVAQVVSGYCGANQANLSTQNGILIETSARHVHLTREAMEALFGTGQTLTRVRDLSQPGEFLSEERVKLVSAKGVMEGVAILGPERDAVQVELSASDAHVLGLMAPVRLSGDRRNAADVYIVGPGGMIVACGSVIIAKAHIHMTPQDALAFGVKDGEHVKVAVKGERPLTFEGVVIRVKDSFSLAMHIDFDEANACLLGKGAQGYLVK